MPPHFVQYFSSARHACARILCCYDEPPGASRPTASIKQSFAGHSEKERSAVVTHLLPALVVAAYALARPFVIRTATRAEEFAVAAAGSAALVFAVSASFHMYRHVHEWGNFMRTADISSIYLTVALNCLADVAIVTTNFRSVRWQTVVDPLLSAVILCLFFLVRRVSTPLIETRRLIPHPHPRAHAHASVEHVDMEHAPIRSAVIALFSLCWIPCISPAFSALPHNLAFLWLFGTIASTFLLWAGSAMDSLHATSSRIGCEASIGLGRGRGCFFDSHALWHVLSTLSVLLVLVIREVILQEMNDAQ
jgi:predicted membrane protein